MHTIPVGRHLSRLLTVLALASLVAGEAPAQSDKAMEATRAALSYPAADLAEIRRYVVTKAKLEAYFAANEAWGAGDVLTKISEHYMEHRASAALGSKPDNSLTARARAYESVPAARKATEGAGLSMREFLILTYAVSEAQTHVYASSANAKSSPVPPHLNPTAVQVVRDNLPAIEAHGMRLIKLMTKRDGQ